VRDKQEHQNMLFVTCKIEVPDDAATMELAVADVINMGLSPFLTHLSVRWERHDGLVVEVPWERLLQMNLMENETPLHELLRWAGGAVLQAQVESEQHELRATSGDWRAVVQHQDGILGAGSVIRVEGPGVVVAELAWRKRHIEDPDRILPEQVRNDLECVLRAKHAAVAASHEQLILAAGVEEQLRMLVPADRAYRTQVLAMVARASGAVEWDFHDPNDASCGRACTPDGCHDSHRTGSVVLDGPETTTESGYDLSDMPQRFREGDGELLAEAGRAVLRLESRIRRLEDFIAKNWRGGDGPLDNIDLDALLAAAAAGPDKG
jgi:hypothetical protein